MLTWGVLTSQYLVHNWFHNCTCLAFWYGIFMPVFCNPHSSVAQTLAANVHENGVFLPLAQCLLALARPPPFSLISWLSRLHSPTIIPTHLLDLSSLLLPNKVSPQLSLRCTRLALSSLLGSDLQPLLVPHLTCLPNCPARTLKSHVTRESLAFPQNQVFPWDFCFLFVVLQVQTSQSPLAPPASLSSLPTSPSPLPKSYWNSAGCSFGKSLSHSLHSQALWNKPVRLPVSLV